MKLVVLGAAGRMGRTLVQVVAETSGAELSGALEQPNSPALGRDAGAVVADDPGRHDI